MIRRILIGALAAILVQTSFPFSASAEQPAPPQAEPTAGTTSAPLHVYANLPHNTRAFNVQDATRGLFQAAAPPVRYSRALEHSLQQPNPTGSGKASSSRNWLLLAGILTGVGVGIYALETIAPKSNDARCSSTTPQFCN
jgi:hypothetical protein